MQRQSTIRRQSRTPDDDIVIKGGYSLCDILIFAGIICCIISFLIGPPLMGLVAVPLLKEYIGVHMNHVETSCTNAAVRNNISNVPTYSLNATVMETNSTNDTTDSANVTRIDNPTTGNLTDMANVTKSANHTEDTGMQNDTMNKCDNGKEYRCQLLRVAYQYGSDVVNANLFRSYKHYIKTNSKCTIYGCALKHRGEHFLRDMRSFPDGFTCYYDSKNTSTVFFRKKPVLGLIVWFSCCSFLLVLGTLPFIACICSKINSPCQGYFQYCTKRYTSRHEKWIDAIKQGNIFILRWSMSQKHINEEMIENYFTNGFKWRAVPLARAAFSGQSHMAEYLLTRGAFTNYEDRLKLTPLHYACYGAQVSTLQLLIAEGADIEARDSCERTPLLITLMLNISVLDIVQYLLEAGADVSVEDKQGCTPLHYACFKGDLHSVHMLIKAGAISNKTVYLNKETFLSNLQNAPFADYCGFKTDLYSSTWTPMTSLLYRNSKEACRLLISAGYNLKQDPILPRVLYSDADEVMNRYIKQQMREVTTLKRICRIWIRGHLGTRQLQQRISTLPLAASLGEYLRLDRID